MLNISENTGLLAPLPACGSRRRRRLAQSFALGALGMLGKLGAHGDLEAVSPTLPQRILGWRGDVLARRSRLLPADRSVTVGVT